MFSRCYEKLMLGLVPSLEEIEQHINEVVGPVMKCACKKRDRGDQQKILCLTEYTSLSPFIGKRQTFVSCQTECQVCMEAHQLIMSVTTEEETAAGKESELCREKVGTNC